MSLGDFHSPGSRVRPYLANRAWALACWMALQCETTVGPWGLVDCSSGLGCGSIRLVIVSHQRIRGDIDIRFSVAIVIVTNVGNLGRLSIASASLAGDILHVGDRVLGRASPQNGPHALDVLGQALGLILAISLDRHSLLLFLFFPCRIFYSSSNLESIRECR